MTDLVERLRDPEPSVRNNAVFAAADEISRLRGRVDRLERQREDLIKVVVDMSRQPPPTSDAAGRCPTCDAWSCSCAKEGA